MAHLSVRRRAPRQHQDEKASGTGYRWGKVGSDDEFNVIPAKYGDSTSAEAPLSALRYPGLTATLRPM